MIEQSTAVANLMRRRDIATHIGDLNLIAEIDAHLARLGVRVVTPAEDLPARYETAIPKPTAKRGPGRPRKETTK
jgi:hypothetical protein